MHVGDGPRTGEADVLDHALDEFDAALEQLVEAVECGALGGRDHAGQVEFMQRFEQVRNRMAVVDHRVVLTGESTALADALTQPSMGRVLVHALRLSPAEASRRVRAAEACSARVTMSGECLPPRRSHLAEAQRQGQVSPEQVSVIVQALSRVDRPGFAVADIDTGEQLLTRFAMTFGTKDLRHLADQTVEAIDPDGTLGAEELSRDRRHVTLRHCSDGMYAGECRLTGAAGAKLTALLQPLSRLRLDPPPGPDGTGPDGTGPDGGTCQESDSRTFGQRTHDALEELCDRVLRAGAVAGAGGTPATVIVTVSLENLLGQLGYGTTSDGTLISTRDVLRLANEAEIIPAVMNHTGAVLSLGRTRRIASSSQTHALIARDHGCSFPGCDRPPEWSERHHIQEWLAGGMTDLDNLTFLCVYHHHNFAARGWTCRMNDDRLPEWIPPRWVDREQRPLLNSRISATLQHRRHQALKNGLRPRATVRAPQKSLVGSGTRRE